MTKTTQSEAGDLLVYPLADCIETESARAFLGMVLEEMPTAEELLPAIYLSDLEAILDKQT